MTRKLIYSLLALMSVITVSKAQTVMQLNGLDCNGNSHDLYADLDAGKAVILHFFMPNCGACPPPAQKIQAMANHILANHPGTITAYAMPFNNTTTCAATASWVTSSNVPLYMPYDSGATQVANYGGFGMPTVVVLGGSGANRRVMFFTMSFSTSDTTIMRDSILALLGITSGVNDLKSSESNIQIFPNPSSDNITIRIPQSETTISSYRIFDVTGKLVMNFKRESFEQVIDISDLAEGVYQLQPFSESAWYPAQKFTVIHSK